MERGAYLKFSGILGEIIFVYLYIYKLNQGAMDLTGILQILLVNIQKICAPYFFHSTKGGGGK